MRIEKAAVESKKHAGVFAAAVLSKYGNSWQNGIHGCAYMEIGRLYNVQSVFSMEFGRKTQKSTWEVCLPIWKLRKTQSVGIRLEIKCLIISW